MDRQTNQPLISAPRPKVYNRTCCNLCHIKFGAAFLGFIETIIAVSVLIGALQQVVWKNQHSSLCDESLFRDCLIFQFNHFNVTLIFDYVVILMMIFIIFSVICLFCGVFSDTSCLILPHIVIQAIFLLFSLGYFFLYAWSYFYGDLYIHKRPFMIQSMIERMWLATLLLALAVLQSYLFSSVIRCSLYLANIEENRRRRESAFERCSERVRIAKENGLWRTTSWGGGFQQYRGQYDKPKKEVKNKGFHVQWNTDVEAAKIISDEEEETLSPIAEEPMVSFGEKLEERRVSNSSTSHNRQNRGLSESPRKEGKMVSNEPRLVKKTSSEGAGRMEEEIRRISKEPMGSKVTHHHHHHHHHRHESKDSPIQVKRNVRIRSTESTKESRSSSKKRRPPLTKNRSVDCSEQFDEVVAFYKDRHRRRSSEADNSSRHHSSQSPDKRDIPIVKKVSISASTAPFS